MNAIRLCNNKICKHIKKYRIITKFKNNKKGIISLDYLENDLNQMAMIKLIFIKNLKLKIKELQWEI